MLLRLLLPCAALASVLSAGQAWAAEPGDNGPPRKRHLLNATTHGGGAWLGGDIDGHYPQGGAYAGFGLGYSLATRGVDFGVAFDYLAVPHREFPRHALIPALALRFHVPLTDTLEFGLELRGGWSWVTMRNVPDDSGKQRDHTFSGLHLGLLPHVRVQLAPRFALDIGGEALVAGGGDNMATGVRTTYLERSARVGAFGAFVRVNFGL